ncbi:SDR family NAD(P)-dependent oxidoreductase [Planomonospora parontospora]|uniref:SDR family NAD(P)-dependent oxidoreductase n=1 Tax=Planomonospora parontospora TaxID=58119 RepID=UPI00166F7329|nr:SDR family oxidoreductase [Planomonospora parontospora]GGL30112.1 short-chain dehydrogenase [Planomonospora parontospora subsp. antibiotica]GII17744.1 short-chain dehydrogenase [Planomonospora parontospora subsp. antibiotica]
MQLTGSRALVTGATSGIGRAIAEAFGREGAHVLVAGRDAARAAEVVAGIAASGGTASPVIADLGAPGGVAALVEAAKAHGPVDVLVNNAGVYPVRGTAQTDEATFEATMNLNVRAPYFLTAALAPLMAAQGRGRIINISSIAAHLGTDNMGLYGASKAALELLTKSWAAEFGPSGVNVNAIAPGPTRTPGTAPMGAGLDEFTSGFPAGRPAVPEEIAGAAVYLAGPGAAFVHGATITVDGGRTAI